MMASGACVCVWVWRIQGKKAWQKVKEEEYWQFMCVLCTHMNWSVFLHPARSIEPWITSTSCRFLWTCPVSTHWQWGQRTAMWPTSSSTGAPCSVALAASCATQRTLPCVDQPTEMVYIHTYVYLKHARTGDIYICTYVHSPDRGLNTYILRQNSMYIHIRKYVRHCPIYQWIAQ